MNENMEFPGKKIVVVDDDETIRKTFFLILNKKYRVYLAGDADEALARFKNAEVDLIIADYKLPRTSGLDLIREFRKCGYRGEVILVSAFPDRIRNEDIRRLSISRFFTKPLDLKAFNTSVDDLLEAPGIV
jgi:DNA-binding response OmpR family regulator